jgi:hypothetical protein
MSLEGKFMGIQSQDVGTQGQPNQPGKPGSQNPGQPDDRSAQHPGRDKTEQDKSKDADKNYQGGEMGNKDRGGAPSRPA